MILYQDCSSHLDSSKNIATRGRGLFSLYIYIEKFKNLLVRNHWTDFNIILQKMFPWWSCTKIIQAIWICQKNMAARGRGLFSLYICIENFKNLHVRNHWTNFHMILQKCSFGYPVARLSSHLDLSKNMAARWAGLIFLIYLYRKL